MGCGNSRESSIDYSMRYTAKSITPVKKSSEEKMKTLTILLVGAENGSFNDIKNELSLKSEIQMMKGEMAGMSIEAFMRTNDRNELPDLYPDSIIDFVIGVIDDENLADQVLYYVKSRKLCSHCIIINKTKKTYSDDSISFLSATDIKNLVNKEITLINAINERFKKDDKNLETILGEEVLKNEFFNQLLNQSPEIIQNIYANLDNGKDDEKIYQEQIRFCIALKCPKKSDSFKLATKRLMFPILIRRIVYYAAETAREMIEKLKMEEISKNENLLYIGNRDKTLNGISAKLNIGLGKYFDKIFKNLSLCAKFNFATAIFELKCKSPESASSIIKSLNTMIEKYQLRELMGDNFDRIHFYQKADKVVFEGYLSEEIYELGQLVIRSIGLEKLKLSFDHLIRITTAINFKSLNLDQLNFEELIELLMKTEISSEFFGDNFSVFAKIFSDTFKKCSENYNKVEFWKSMKTKEIITSQTLLFFVNTYFSTKFELITDAKTAYNYLINLINYQENKYSSYNETDNFAYKKVLLEIGEKMSKMSSAYKSNIKEANSHLHLTEEFSMKNHIDLSIIDIKIVVPSLRFFINLTLNLPEIDTFINKYI